MGYIVRVPDLGSKAERATLATWVTDQEDKVEADDTVAEIAVGDHIEEIRALQSGVLLRQYIEEGDPISPGTPIGIIAHPHADILNLEAEAIAELEKDTLHETNGVVLPERRVSACVGPDISGTITAGSFEYRFGPGEAFGSTNAPTPIDFLLGSLAACLSTSIAVQASIRDVNFHSIDVEAEASPTEGSVEAIDLIITIDAATDEDTVERMVTNGERTCHVSELLRDDLSVDLIWEAA